MNLNEDERLLLTASATHQEIQKGFITHAKEDAGHVFAWRRQFSNLADLDEKTRKIFTDGQLEKIEDLSGSLKAMLGSRFVEKQAVVADLEYKDGKLSAYLESFEKEIYEALWTKIEQQIDETPACNEEDIHREFAKSRSEGFVGRSDKLQEMADYLANHNPHPYLVSAPGGMGKTSLLAKCVTDNADTTWIVRFAGASSSIGDPQTLLDSLWPSKEQLTEACRKAAKSTQAALEDLLDQLLVGYTQRSEKLQSLLIKDELTTNDRTDLEWALVDVAGQRKRQLIADMTAGFMERRETSLVKYLEIIRNLRGGKVVVVIDALDQLPGSPDLAYLIGRLGKIAGDRTGLPDGVWLVATQRDEQATGLSGLLQDDWNQLVVQRLQLAGRQLQAPQRQWLASGFSKSGGNPLALKLAMERGLLFPSMEAPPTGPFNVEGLIGDLFDRLEDPHQHGLLGARALAYLAFARQGLPEEALLDALAGDEKIRQWFDKQVEETKQAWSLDDGLPPVLWSRLHMDLEPYLVYRDVFGTPALHFFHREFRQKANDYAAKLVGAAEVPLNLVRVACNRIGIGDTCDPGRLSPGLYQNQADGWALGELPWLLEQAGDKQKSRQLLETPAFVMAKVSIPGGIESLAADYSRHAESPWAALFQCHYAALLLNEDPKQLLIQRASELAPDSTPRRAVEEWLKQVDIVWIRNAVVHPNPRYEIELGKDAPRFETLDNGQIACWPSWKGDDLSRTVRILGPDLITGPVHFLENPWQDYSGGTVQKGHVEEIVGLPGADWLVTRHTAGPLLVWQGERNIAKLVDVVFEETSDEYRQLWGSLSKEAPPTEKEYIGKTPVVRIFAAADRALIAVYEDGLVGRWHLPADLARAGTDSPRELRSDVPEYFSILAEEDPEQCKNRYGKVLERRLVKFHREGDNLTLVFNPSVALSPRIVFICGQSCRQFYGRSSYEQQNSFDQFLPTTEGCYVVGDGFKSILYLTEAGDAQLSFQVEEGDLVSAVYRDTEDGLILLLEKDLPNTADPWALAHFQSDEKFIWRRGGLLQKKPLAFEEAGIFFYQTNDQDGVVCLRLSDHSERVCDLPHIPKGVTTLDREILLVWDESSFYQIDLATGHTAPCPTGRGIADVSPQAKDILATHDDGHLRSWSLQCLASQKNGAPTAIADVGCIAALDKDRILVCSDDAMVMWQASSDEKWQHSIVWHAGKDEDKDRVNCVTVLAEDSLITWGNKFIRIWQTTPEWQLRQTLSTRRPVRAVLKIDDARYFYEFGEGPDSWRGDKIGLLSRKGEEWLANTEDTPSEEDWKFHSFLTPVMSDGSVLFLVEKEGNDIAAKYSLLLPNHSSFLLLDQNDERLHDWLSVHRAEFEQAHQQVIAELSEWAHGVHYGEQDENLSGWADWLERKSQDLPSGDDDVPLGLRFQQSYPPTLELAIRDNAVLRTASLSDIVIRDSEFGPDQALVKYRGSGNFRLWVNRLQTHGSLFLTDSDRNLHILQLMRGNTAGRLK
jgi:hypothetical protein